jgi:CubicO group peptidase (beta-lactamase class C family)
MRRFFLMLVMWAGFGVAVAQAQEPMARPSRPIVGAPAKELGGATTPVMTKADIDVWLDGVMPYAMKTGDVAGAVVVVVRDGAVVTERGYGYADVALKRPVDPKATLFRPGSVSKLFTWTAVMQLVERRKINLDADINTYLDFKIPPYQGQPITMRQLMTHTSGFELKLEGLITEGGTPPSLQAMVKDWVPRRIFAPGTTPAYSNYATMLAGYIVQRVSGERYEDYVAHHVFAPLGMEHSTVMQPLPSSLAPLASQGYSRASQPAKPFEFINFQPAGAASVTGEDMAKFMLAHLDPEHNALLQPGTMRRMHDTTLPTLPTLPQLNNRMALGFYEQNLNGHRIIAHGGDTRWFHSAVWLLPDDRTGVFFSMNSSGAGATTATLRAVLIQAFMNRYFPAGPTATAPFTPRPENAALMAGLYQSSGRSESGLRRAKNFFSQMEVSVTADGGLQVPGIYFIGPDGDPRDWVEIAPFVWKDRNSEERLSAEVKDGKVVRFSVGSYAPIAMFYPVPWYSSTAWLNPALALSLLTLAGFVILAPVGWIYRRVKVAARRFEGRELGAYASTVVLAVMALALLRCWSVLLDSLGFQSLGVRTTLLQLATIVVLPGLVLLSGGLLAAAFQKKRHWAIVLLRLLVLLAAALVLAAAVVFNLLHVGLHY